MRETTKSRRARRVRLDAATGAALRRWKAEQSAERLAFGAPWRTDGGHRLATEGDWITTEPNGYILRISRQLGHASLATTADIYSHPDDVAPAAAEALGEILGNERARG